MNQSADIGVKTGTVILISALSVDSYPGTLLERDVRILTLRRFVMGGL